MEIGLYDYNLLAWEENGANSVDLVLSIPSTPHGLFNADRAGVAAVTAPLAIAVQNPFSGVLFRHMRDTFQAMPRRHSGENSDGTPPAGADALKERGVLWLTPGYNYTSQHDRVGYDIKGPHWTAGFDYSVTDDFFLGAALSFALPEYESGGADIDATAITGSLYGGAALPWQLELGAFAAYTHTAYEQTRKITWRKIDSDYDSETWSVGLNLARPFDLTETWSLRPFVGYEFMHISVDANDEDSPALRALNFDSYDNNLHRVTAGADLIWTSDCGLYAGGRVFYVGLYGDREGETTAVFNADPQQRTFTSTGDALDEHSLGLGLDFGLPVHDNIELRAGYGFLTGDDSRTHQGDIGIVVRF